MPSPGLEVLSGILASSVTPLTTLPPQTSARGVLAEDEDAYIRLFHDRAFYAASGIDFDLFPVDLDTGSRVLLSTVTSSPDAPMLTGQGWMLFRDSAGKAAVVLTNNATTLESLQAALSASELAVGTAIVQDSGGFRLMVVLDEEVAQQLRPGGMGYAPAESVSSPATVRFGESRLMGFPFEEFAAVDGALVALDLGWGNSSAQNGALTLDGQDCAGLQAAPYGGRGGWESFDVYASVDRSGPAPILVQEEQVTVDRLGDLPGAGERAVAVREGQWFVEVDGAWMAAEGNAAQAFETFRELDPADYRIIFAE